MKMDSNGTTVRPDTRKGKLAVHKSNEDGLMHLTWTDRSGGAQTVILANHHSHQFCDHRSDFHTSLMCMQMMYPIFWYLEGVVEDDFIIFPGDATFSYVDKARDNAKNSRIYVLKFTSTNKLHFFWMQVCSQPACDCELRLILPLWFADVLILQEPKDDKDAELTGKVNAFINGVRSIC